jgi:hypothetical protein
VVCVVLAGVEHGWVRALWVAGALAAISLLSLLGKALGIERRSGALSDAAAAVIGLAVLGLMFFVAIFLPCWGSLC